MRAAVLTGWREDLALTEVPDPSCPDDGVVLRVLACGVCRSDWHAWTGADPVPLPHVLGHELSGEVVAVGPHVRGWRAGERVVAPFILGCGRCADCAAGNQTVCAHQVLPGFSVRGAYAELVAIPHADHNLVRLPDGLDAALAAALGCRATTAWHALTGRAALRGGEWLAVVGGGGGVGLAALLLGRALGARVVVVDVVPEKLGYAASLGAEAAVDGRDGDPAEAIRELTGGGAHVAVEALGIGDTTEVSIRSLRPLGRHVQVGMPTGEHTTMALPMDVVYARQLALFGTRGMPAWRFPGLLSLIESGRVDLAPLVGRRVPLSAASAELAAFDTAAPPGVAVITDLRG